MIEVRASVSAPGSPRRANEDGCGSAGLYAWVIDGATGLGDEALLDAPSDAAWLTAVLHEALMAGAEAETRPLELLRSAANVATERFNAERRRAPRERYEVPTAAVMLARFGDVIEIVELGDCGLWIETDGVMYRVGGSDRQRQWENESARRLMGGGQGRTPEVTAYLRTVRNTANTPEGYPVFAPDHGSVRRARQHVYGARQGRALLITDGFEAAIDDYGLYDGAGLMAAVEGDVDGTLATIRAVEADDPDCTRYPRFKRSDDATALMLRFAAD
ncbi:protein phosphatase 2C domain-containing protein [Acuticoccus sediminis]|uniref:protein phosphatase 2C domain-containing protein n=1 Tax=Acuticoccus sediminis TaxID=2184697 RepID=UPI001CFCE28E|nr:protein phosphatase 2C domain-containing protein [Acuticoccus sediminis]